MSLCALAFLVIDWVVRPAALKKLWWEDPSMHYLLKKPLHHHQIHYLFSISAGVIKTVKTGYLLHFKSKTFQYLKVPKVQLVLFFRTTFWKGLEGGICCPLWGQFSYLVSRSRPKWTRGRHSPQGRSRNVGSGTGKCIGFSSFREKASLKVF